MIRFPPRLVFFLLTADTILSPLKCSMAQSSRMFRPEPDLRRAQVIDALYELRCAVAGSDLQRLRESLAAEFSESGIASDREDALEAFGVMFQRAAIRDTLQRPLAHRSRGAARLRKPPFWDFNLDDPDVALVSDGSEASVLCRAAFYALSADTTVGMRSERTHFQQNVVLEFRNMGGVWRLARSEELLSFIARAVSLFEIEPGSVPASK